MTRLLPNPPPPSAQITTEGAKPDQDYIRFLKETIDVLRHRLPIVGNAAFSASTSVAVTLDNELPDALYQVLVDASENNTFWVDPVSKAKTGFTINASSSTSATVGWTLIRD